MRLPSPNHPLRSGSYSEMGSEKFSNSAKSGYNKGTIRSDLRYLVVSTDVRRHRLISIDYITVLPCHGRYRRHATLGAGMKITRSLTLGFPRQVRSFFYTPLWRGAASAPHPVPYSAVRLGRLPFPGRLGSAPEITITSVFALTSHSRSSCRHCFSGLILSVS